MNKNKIISLVLSLGIFTAISPIAYAQVDGYLIKDKQTNTVYQYTLKNLLSSLRSPEKELYKQFQQECATNGGIFAYHDDSGKTVSHAEVAKTFIRNRDNFNLNKFISSDKSHNIKIENIKMIDTNSKNDDIKNIHTPKELEQYLNTHCRSIQTPIGLINVSNTIITNDTEDKFYSQLPFDMFIRTNWDLNMNIENINNISKDKAYDTIKILQNYQKGIYNLASSIFPQQKITGGFCKDNPEQRFCMWLNYTTNMTIGYYTAPLDKFHWDKDIDTYYFNYKGENLYRYK